MFASEGMLAAARHHRAEVRRGGQVNFSDMSLGNVRIVIEILVHISLSGVINHYDR